MNKGLFMIPKNVVICLSGGIDSVTLLHQIKREGHNVHAVMFDYHQRHVQELTFARHHCHLLEVLYTTIQVPLLRGSELTDGNGGPVLPFRNAILLGLAVNLADDAEAESVLFAANKSDAEMFPDCRPAFVDAMNATLRACESPVAIFAPFIDMAKWEIVKLARKLGVDLNQTWSCYRGGAQPCGKCLACKTRREALEGHAGE